MNPWLSLEPTLGGPDYGGDTVRAARDGVSGVRAYGVWGGLRRGARRRMSRAGWRLRTRWRSVLSRGARLTGAAVAAFVAAELVGLRDPPPLIAALTALLVVEAT